MKDLFDFYQVNTINMKSFWDERSKSRDLSEMKDLFDFYQVNTIKMTDLSEMKDH